MTQRRVLIGTPAYTWAVDVRYVHSLGMTIKHCLASGIDLRWVFTPGDALVQSACNDLVAIALEKGFDDMIIIGSDQDWEPQWITQLLAYPVDCVAGPVRKKTDEAERYNVKNRSGFFTKHPKLPLLTAPDMAVGTGFMRLSRNAMECLWNAAEKYTVGDNKRQAAWIFDVRPVNGELVGEDIHICHVLRERGIEIWLDPAINGGHVGQKRWQGDFLSWLERQAP